jgi:uncharacterized protein YjbI with pentapeptide repeats
MTEPAKEKNTSTMRLLRRLRDRSRWPRSWWYPLPRESKFDPGVLSALHKECSETIRRSMMVLLGFAFFCLLTALGSKDQLLIGGQAEINVPFANVPISFIGFVAIAPLLLIILSIYLHVFVGHLREIEAAMVDAEMRANAGRMPTIFNLEAAVPRWLTAFIFYWLVPFVLAAITWRAMAVPPYGIALGSLTLFVTFALLFLKIRRSPAENSHWPNRLYWLGMAPIIGATAFMNEDFRRPLDLSRADFKNAYLASEDLQKANIYLASFKWANLSEANLCKTNLTKVDLSGANLHWANLNLAQLFETNLSGADLYKAQLVMANMPKANLSGANLHRAELIGAGLFMANLSGANLSHANLRRVNLGYANLSEANLSSANLNSAILVGARFWNPELEDGELAKAQVEACARLTSARGWEKASRDAAMYCGGDPAPSRESPGNPFENVDDPCYDNVDKDSGTLSDHGHDLR